MCSPYPVLRQFFLAALLYFELLPANIVYTAEPHWNRLDSSHFSVLTDGDEKSGREIVVRFEQMRGVFAQLLMKSRVNMPEITDIIAVRSNDEFSRLAPTRRSKSIARGGFFIAGPDRNYFVLDLSANDSWRAISRDFGRVLLNYNYPPTQSWFDEGLLEYFASVYLDNAQMQIGGDPEASAPVRQDASGKSAETGGTSKSFVELLNGSAWLSIPELFSQRPDNAASEENRHTMFYAQSWIVMHYLLNTDKLSATGTYFGLVEIEKAPVEEAIQKAYGMGSAQLEQSAKDYFHTLASTLQAQGAAKTGPLSPSAAPVSAEMVGATTHQIATAEGDAALAEMSLRLPEHREQARQQLNSLAGDPKSDNAIVRRALGWDFMEQNRFDEAVDELAQATSLDPRDPLTHYYLALWKYREAQLSGGHTKGLANMMQDLHIVLDWNHELAEAHSMLGMAQLEGGGLHAAADSMRAAIELSPRNQGYLLNMARIYLAGKNWDAATALLERLAAGSDPGLAGAARSNLEDIPYLKKYGVAPQHGAGSQTASKPAAAPPSGLSPPALGPVTTAASAPKKSGGTPAAPAPAESDNEDNDQIPPEQQIDKRPIVYVKGRLISVDCSQAPIAVLTVSVGANNLRLRAADYQSLPLIGSDQFSCAWTNRAVSVNYKAGGKADGDLVSLELR